jgi:hypothetical protein
MLKGSAFLAHSVTGHGADCVAKVVCNGRANFLTAAEALDLSGRGGPRQLTDATGGLPIRFESASLAENGDDLTFARITLRRHF